MQYFRFRSVAGVLLVVALVAAHSSSAEVFDRGAPDSLMLVASRPSASGSGKFLVELYLWTDSQSIAATTIGFHWDSPKVTLDSARWEIKQDSIFDLFSFLLLYDDIQASNDSQFFQLSAGRMSDTGGLAPTGSWQHLATYFFSTASWFIFDSVAIDTGRVTLVNGLKSAYKLTDTEIPLHEILPVWRGPLVLRDPADAPDGGGGQLPLSFALGQNYPNPFNPTTSISFDLPEACHVWLNVHNILGQRVRTIVDATLAAGTHTVQWDAREDGGQSVASGVYFYRLQTPEYSATRKMLLLR
jgi:hypothetical protein